jgi:hypothetical protein
MLDGLRAGEKAGVNNVAILALFHDFFAFFDQS